MQVLRLRKIQPSHRISIVYRLFTFVLKLFDFVPAKFLSHRCNCIFKFVDFQYRTFQSLTLKFVSIDAQWNSHSRIIELNCFLSIELTESSKHHFLCWGSRNTSTSTIRRSPWSKFFSNVLFFQTKSTLKIQRILDDFLRGIICDLLGRVYVIFVFVWPRYRLTFVARFRIKVVNVCGRDGVATRCVRNRNFYHRSVQEKMLWILAIRMIVLTMIPKGRGMNDWPLVMTVVRVFHILTRGPRLIIGARHVLMASLWVLKLKT